MELLFKIAQSYGLLLILITACTILVKSFVNNDLKEIFKEIFIFTHLAVAVVAVFAYAIVATIGIWKG